jgi:hypothetical protein
VKAASSTIINPVKTTEFLCRLSFSLRSAFNSVEPEDGPKILGRV